MSTGHYGSKGNNIGERAVADSGKPGARRKRKMETIKTKEPMKSGEREPIRRKQKTSGAKA